MCCLLLRCAAGDTVSNMDLGPALAAHKERADRDKDAIMTVVRLQRCGLRFNVVWVLSLRRTSAALLTVPNGGLAQHVLKQR